MAKPDLSRPYRRNSIEDLERLFDRSQLDRQVLAAILDELLNRSTERAGRLRQKIETSLRCEAGNGKSGPTHQTSDRRTSNRPGATSGKPSQPVRPEPKPPRSHPPSRDRPEDILSAWVALEVLSPATYRKPEDLVSKEARLIANLGPGLSLPWAGDGERSRPRNKLFYHAVIGAIRMSEATSELLASFVDQNQDRRPPQGFAAMATITVDKRGCLVPEGACKVSSFAWGLPFALKQDLVSLSEWPEAEQKLLDQLDAKLRRSDRDGKPIPLDWPAITGACQWLASELKLPNHLVEPPSFAIRAYHWMFAQEPPESPLLGSFYLEDLTAARALARAGKLPKNLARFLGLMPPAARRDVLQEKELIVEEGVAPARMPPGRWPSKGGHPLVTLQQLAVNTAASGDLDLVAINGPPGTGKTTLLRDLVADLVVKRAKVMASFDDPERAFTPGDSIRVSNAQVTMSYLDARLRGYEMVVASSNNAAVENVSKALPMLDAVADDASGLRYFKNVSDQLAESDETWGLVAAVLGNAGNRYQFRERAWTDRDYGLQAYLAEAAGVPMWIEEKTETSVGRRKPLVIERERPPASHDEAIRHWRTARKAFLAALDDVEARLTKLQAGRDAVVGIERLTVDARLAGDAVRRTDADRDQSKVRLDQMRELCRQAVRASQEAAVAVDQSAAARPSFLSRLLRTAEAKSWKGEHRAALQRKLSMEQLARKAADAVIEDEGRFSAATTAAEKALNARIDAEKARDAASACIDAVRRRCGDRVVDSSFFAAGHEEWNKRSPWLTDEDHRARDRVFEAAMALHRAFVDASARHIRHNLDVLLRTFFGNLRNSPKVKPMLPDLWSSLFLVVPVVSTTFASVERMLSGIPPEGLGWLLVDEAGQAVPQAAVGALVRAKHAVVVGDPLQVPPVTTLPTALAETICRQFGVNPARWNAPEVSVQTVVDASSPLMAEFQQVTGTVSVGLPLLVHRRCMDPMFSVANAVAYSGLMVHATRARPSPIRDAVGTSRWIDVPPGETDDKWSEAEGVVVLELIQAMVAAGVPELDVYIITPFRIVEQRLRERMRASGLLSNWSFDARKWMGARIGTVHKVQGREADSVIFVLGAPLPAHRGARAWAGATPNILNVAVTRAQENLYVVGAHAAWSDIGPFRSLAAAMHIDGLVSTERKLDWSRRAGT